tara:strand:- start:467 stop:1135 length:669 start_codon:yes stop_codon:yes gene_type:complete
MFYKYIKRFLDLISSIILLTILSPILLPVIIILLFSAEGEVFYLQKRIGYKLKSFNIFKFATMLKNSENIGMGTITLKNDYRVTKPGKILRKTKINELPQLINIIIGDISVVGPRPLLKKTFDSYPENVKEKIYLIKPGLTGIGSIVFRDEESILSNIKNENPHDFYKSVIAPYKGELELWYQDNQSFQVDLKILFTTLWVIIFPESRIYESWFENLPKRRF